MTESLGLEPKMFEYRMPARIVFGYGVVEQLPTLVWEYTNGAVLVVTEKGVRNAGVTETVETVLRRAGIRFTVFDGVVPEPTVGQVREAVRRGQEVGCTLVIGVGGGSAMDTAKAAALSMLYPDVDITTWAGWDKVPGDGLPTICIPTTAGTASEVTFWSVLQNDERTHKFGVGSWYLFPEVALCDPTLTVTLPPAPTAYSGLDALAHAIESYVSKKANDITRIHARRAIQLIGRYLVRAVQNGAKDHEARYGMLLASLEAGLAFNLTRLGLVHALAMPLGGMFQIPHGLACALVMPAVLEYNASAVPELYLEIASLLGTSAPVWEYVVDLLRQCGVRQRLREFGVTEMDLDRIATEAINSDNCLCNPREATVDDLKAIVGRCL